MKLLPVIMLMLVMPLCKADPQNPEAVAKAMEEQQRINVANAMKQQQISNDYANLLESIQQLKDRVVSLHQKLDSLTEAVDSFSKQLEEEIDNKAKEQTQTHE